MIRVYTVAIPSVHCRRIAIIAGQGPAVLEAGTGLKLSDFWGYLFNFNGGFARKLNGDFFFFLAFFCKIQCKLY